MNKTNQSFRVNKNKSNVVFDSRPKTMYDSLRTCNE